MSPDVPPGQKTIILMLFVAILALGCFFRVYGLGARDLWTDEAWVALAAIQPTPAAALQAGKSTPPLYLLTVWSSVQLFGQSEAVLRLTSCLLGLGTLLLLWPLALALLPPWTALTAFTLGSVSNRLVYFSKELKQYSADIFFATLVFFLVERQLARQGRGGWLRFTALLALGLGFSHPLVFILPVAALVLWWQLPRARRAVVLSFGALGLIFSGYYWFFFRGQVDPELLAYWQCDFPAVTCGRDFACWLGAAWSRFGRYFFDDWGAPLGLAFLVAGLAYFFRSAKTRVIWYFFGPLLMALAAAFAQRYPFMGRAGGVRLMMFSAPMLYLVTGAGIGALFNWLWQQQSIVVAPDTSLSTPHPAPLPSGGEGIRKDGLGGNAILDDPHPWPLEAEADSKGKRVDFKGKWADPRATGATAKKKLKYLTNWPRGAAILLAAVVLIWLQPVDLWQENLRPQANREEIAPLLQYLHCHRRPGDAIYVYYFAVDPFKYYYQGPQEDIIWGQSCQDTFLPWPEARLRRIGRLWLVFSHFETTAFVDSFVANLLGPGWTRQLELSQPGALLFCYLPPWADIAPGGAPVRSPGPY